MAGGHKSGTGLIDKTFLYHVTNDAWSEGPPMSEARWGHTCQLITDANGDRKVMAVAGKTSGGFANSVDIFDVDSQTWTLGTAPYPEKVISLGSAKYMDSFVAFGGFNPNDGGLSKGLY